MNMTGSLRFRATKVGADTDPERYLAAHKAGSCKEEGDQAPVSGWRSD